jgi:DNA-3-methyladenine glycosylase II
VHAADAHLARDPVMARLIEGWGGPLPTHRPDRRRVAGPGSRGRPAEHYAALVRSIAGQQLSVKAAQSIWNRLLERFGGHPPTPEQILADDPADLRAACGFSNAKVRYLRSLAEHVLDGSLELHRLPELPDEQVVAELTAVRGIGEWTAQMFLMFTLHRPDVLPLGDLGVRNAFARHYAETAADLATTAEGWRPYRTRACLYLWRSLDNLPAG